jgi:hypothetical protein
MSTFEGRNPLKGIECVATRETALHIELQSPEGD